MFDLEDHYWEDAIIRIAVRKHCVARGKTLDQMNEIQWRELEKLSWVERFALACQYPPDLEKPDAT